MDEHRRILQNRSVKEFFARKCFCSRSSFLSLNKSSIHWNQLKLSIKITSFLLKELETITSKQIFEQFTKLAVY